MMVLWRVIASLSLPAFFGLVGQIWDKIYAPITVYFKLTQIAVSDLLMTALPLVNFWISTHHRTPTPLNWVDGTLTTYALCFARSITSFLIQGYEQEIMWWRSWVKAYKI